MDLVRLKDRFEEEFGEACQWVVRAPGRVNLIGEHTDYNDGFVLPVAIDRYLVILASRRPDKLIEARSLDFSQKSVFELEKIESDSRAPWSNYVRGVIVQYQRRGFELPGMNLMIVGNVPIGSGLSSSAALEVATAETCRVLAGVPIDKVEMARLCQAAEHEFVGVQCGIMDQFVSTLAEDNSALFLDCRSLEFSLVGLKLAVRLVVCDSCVQRSLDNSEYNRRRSECEQAVAELQNEFPEVVALRDVQPDQLQRAGGRLAETLFRRARHVVDENQRVLRAVEALKGGQLKTIGELLYESHRSLREDYQVSCPELDLLVELARKQPGTVGARMTGAGFGGCTVNLVEPSQVDDFCRNVQQDYQRKTGLEGRIHVCQASAGVTSQAA